MLTAETYAMLYNAMTALETSSELQLNLARMIIEFMDKIMTEDFITLEMCREYTRARLKLKEIYDDNEHIVGSIILLKAILLKFSKPGTEEPVCEEKTNT